TKKNRRGLGDMELKRSISRGIFLLVFALALVLSPGGEVFAAVADFNHNTTGFPLDGPHQNLSCESCHVAAQFKGTPRHCIACPAMRSMVPASPKQITHINSSEQCLSSHTGNPWDVVLRVHHAGVRGSCASWHNSAVAIGKPSVDIQSSSNCGSCHNTAAWAS